MHRGHRVTDLLIVLPIPLVAVPPTLMLEGLDQLHFRHAFEHPKHHSSGPFCEPIVRVA